MKKSLEDIRCRYSKNNSFEGGGSEAVRPSTAPYCSSNEADSSSKSNSHTTPLNYQKSTSLPSPADFTKINDFSSTAIADDLDNLYANDTVDLGAIFPQGLADSRRSSEHIADETSSHTSHSGFTLDSHRTLSSLPAIIEEREEPIMMSREPSSKGCSADGKGTSRTDLNPAHPCNIMLMDCNGNLTKCLHSTFTAQGGNAVPPKELPIETLSTIPDFNANVADVSEVYDLPKPSDHIEHEWLPQTITRLVLGTSGCYYEGQIYKSKMDGHGRFYFGENQYIEGKWEANNLVELNVGQLTVHTRNCNLTVSVFKTLKAHFVSIHEYNLVARAIASSFKMLDFNACVADLKSLFLGKLNIERILSDELQSKREALLWKFKEDSLKHAVTEEAGAVKNATVLYLIGKYTKHGGFLNGIMRSEVFSPVLRAAATDILEIERVIKERNRVISNYFTMSDFEPYRNAREFFGDIYADLIEEHRRALLCECPADFPELMDFVEELPGEVIIYITREDVGVFHQLLSLPCARNDGTHEHVQNIFGAFLEGFSRRLQVCRTETPPFAVIPLTSSVFPYLFNSFSEIAEVIVGAADGCLFQDLLDLDNDGNWELKGDIRWPTVEETMAGSLRNLHMLRSKKRLHQKSLEAQYHAIFEMLMFFSPESYLKDRAFTFEFHVLKFDPTWWMRSPNDGGEKLLGLADVEGFPKDRLAWLYILDFTVHQLLKDDTRPLEFLKLYNPLFQGYISFLYKSAADTHESFRVLMHSIIEFLISSAAYRTENIRKGSLDFEVLNFQMWTMTAAARDMESGRDSLASFRDLFEAYKKRTEVQITPLQEDRGSGSARRHVHFF